MTEAVEQLSSRSQAQWWNKPRSLKDIAEHLERAVKLEENLERKLTELLAENNRLARRCAQADADLAATMESMEKLKSKPAVRGRQEAELAVRERLLRDEFERKTQEIRLEMKKERLQLVESVEQLKKELEGCFCRKHSDEYVVHIKKGFEPKVLRNPSRRVT